MADCDITGDDGGANLNNPNSIVDAAVEAGSGEPKKKKTHRLKQRFQVIKKLGQGTYGKVQLAINNESGQEVAIKTIKKSKVANQQDLIRIRREIQIMSSINHPNIIHIFEVFENKDKIVLVMQYASGGELYDYVSYHKVLSDTEARRVFRQIATAIYYCHKNKICHRDLKLENILLDEKGNAKIADFGLSNVFDEKHFLQTFCGSPLYASPEIVRGLPYFGPEVDCWSLGVLLYTLVYGAMPFDGSNFKKLVKQISEANYYEPTNKSEASDLIRRLLAPNPRERATIIDICTDEWVNLECEHSLLQLAEDLSNLTKYAVRLDMLLALAPVSPTTDQVAKETTEKSTPQEGDQEKAVEEESGAEKRPVDNTSFNVSSSDVIEKKASKKKIKKSDTATVEEKESVKESSQYEDKPMEVVPPEPDLSQTPESSSQQQPEAPSEDTSPTEDPTPAPVSEPISEDITDPQIITSADTTEVVEEKKENEPASNLSQSASTSSNTSVGKRPGRVSIPSIWNSSQEKLAPESPQDKKAPFIPVGFKVSEAKQVLERRCSVDSNKGSAAKRRESLAATSELATGQQKRDVKKYTTRSLSLNEIGSDKKYVPAKRTIKPVIEEKRVEEAKEEKTEPEVVKVPSRDGTPISTDQESSKPSTPITEDDKSIAKLIIKKNIAKAKLMEKRQGSVTPSGSEPTTPLVAIENSSVSTIQFPSNSSTFTETRDKQSELVQSQTGSEDNTGEVCQVATPASAAAPITRSYKKVTFTKDGACITESGKFYSKEGKDGVVTRVEKKSKVTHIIGGQPPTSTVNLQRSDSQSSSGSTDIFDDIFDDHWTGDVFFSNFKSLFNNFFDNSGNNTRGVGSGNDDRRSLRSRAESLERTNWFAGRPNRRTAFSTDNSFDSNSSIFDSHKSLFQTKSIFSSSFKSNFDKEFDDLMSRKSTLLPRLTRQFGDSESESNSTSRRFADVDPDPVESTRKRVEQWLQLDDSKDKFGSIGSYGTMGPRASRRYMRTMTSNESGSNFVKHSEVTKSSNSSSHEIIRQQTSSSIQNMKKDVVPQGSEVEIKFSLDGLGGELGKSMLSSATFTMDKSISSESNNSMIKIAEPSSLLEQLRTIGYKKMVSRRLSDESSEEGEPTVASQSASSLARSTEDGTQGNGVPVGAFTETPLVGQRRDRGGGVADQHESTRSLGGENESVQERIHRKSYYSRFNDTATTMVRQRRRSVTRLSNDLAELYSSPTGSVGTTTGGRVRSGTTGLYSRSPSYGFSLDSGSSSSLTSRTRTHWTSSVTRRTTLRSTSLDANSDKHTRENDS